MFSGQASARRFRAGGAMVWAAIVVSAALTLRGEQPVQSPPVDLGLPLVDEVSNGGESAWPGSPWESPSWGFLPVEASWLPNLSQDSTRYVLAEAVGFQRDNQSNGKPLVIDALTGDPVLSTGDLNAPMGYGVRTFVGRRRDEGWGREAGYLGVYGMGTTRNASGLSNLQLDGPLSGLVPVPFLDSDRVEATYSSVLQSAEYNVFKSRTRAVRNGGGPGTFCFDWLGGLRYVSLEEQAGLDFTCCTTTPGVGPFSSAYDVQTSNNLFGGQLGGRASRTWRNWAVESWAKFGAFANCQSQAQSPILDPLDPTTPARAYRSSSGVQTSLLTDINASLVYRINSVLGLRFGYNFLWAGNVALAPDQWDFGASDDSGTTLVGNGGISLSGFNCGLEARW